MISKTGFKDGYKDGYNHGRQQKSMKIKPNLGKALISTVYLDEFTKGYKDGYSSGLRDASRA